MEKCIVYFSTWVGPFREDELVAILEQYRQRNAVEGITSVTLYVRGNIIQIMEGQPEMIDALYSRIEQDPRHVNLTQVLNRPITNRIFTGTALGYDAISSCQLDEIKALVDLESDPETARPAPDHIILKTLQAFYQSNRYN